MISGHTQLFFLLAHPVEHVRTPQMFNAYLEARNVDAVVVAIDVPAPGLRDVVHGLRRAANVKGIIVTMPHKSEIVSLCDSLHESARGVGAVNIVRRERDGTLVGANFDGLGFVQALEAADARVAGRSVFMAGAGGVGRAIAFAVAAAGARSLEIYNRSEAKARDLAAALGEAYPTVGIGIAGASPRHADIAINATSLGLHPRDPLPFVIDALPSHAAVAEVVMQPQITPLLSAARERGLRIVPGDGMLAMQLPLWMDFIELR